MATFDAFVATDMRQFDLLAGFANPTFFANGPTHFDIFQDRPNPQSDLGVHVEGRDFYYGSDTDPNSGTITKLTLGEGFVFNGSLIFDQKYFELTGVSMTIAKFESLAFQAPIEMARYLLRGNDTIIGSEGTDYLLGFAGNDVFRGGGNFDQFAGGVGNDRYYIDGGRAIERANQGIDTQITSRDCNMIGDFNIENLILTGADGLYGIGNGLKNTITGSAGGDVIGGARGNDILQGRAGRDSYYFDSSGVGNADRIVGFSRADDRIWLEKEDFDRAGTGVLKVGLFKDIGRDGAVIDRNDRVIYDSDTGHLWYDGNGSLAGQRSLVATLVKHPTIAANDIFIDFFV